MPRLGVFAAHPQAVHNGLETNAVAALAVLDAVAHLRADGLAHLGIACYRHHSSLCISTSTRFEPPFPGDLEMPLWVQYSHKIQGFQLGILPVSQAQCHPLCVGYSTLISPIFPHRHQLQERHHLPHQCWTATGAPRLDRRQGRELGKTSTVLLSRSTRTVILASPEKEHKEL